MENVPKSDRESSDHTSNIEKRGPLVSGICIAMGTPASPAMKRFVSAPAVTERNSGVVDPGGPVCQLIVAIRLQLTATCFDFAGWNHSLT